MPKHQNLDPPANAPMAHCYRLKTMMKPVSPEWLHVYEDSERFNQLEFLPYIWAKYSMLDCYTVLKNMKIYKMYPVSILNTENDGCNFSRL